MMLEIVSRIAEHPFAAGVALSALLLLLRGAGVRLGPAAAISKRFMTSRESAMLTVLEGLLPHCRIHAQVAMGALLDAPRPIGRRAFPSDRNAFSRKIVDFVAQDRASGRVVAIIEVDDRTHLRERDRARDRMTAQAGYRTIRIPAHARPTQVDVGAALGDVVPTPRPPVGAMA